jgi:hypothetical protein
MCGRHSETTGSQGGPQRSTIGEPLRRGARFQRAQSRIDKFGMLETCPTWKRSRGPRPVPSRCTAARAVRNAGKPFPQPPDRAGFRRRKLSLAWRKLTRLQQTWPSRIQAAPILRCGIRRRAAERRRTCVDITLRVMRLIRHGSTPCGALRSRRARNGVPSSDGSSSRIRSRSSVRFLSSHSFEDTRYGYKNPNESAGHRGRKSPRAQFAVNSGQPAAVERYASAQLTRVAIATPDRHEAGGYGRWATPLRGLGQEIGRGATGRPTETRKTA